MDWVLVCILVNYREIGERSPFKIYFCSEMPKGDQYRTRDVDLHGYTYHSTLHATKAAIRFEQGTPGGPRFKWKNVTHAN